MSKNSNGSLFASGGDHDDCTIIVWDTQSHMQRSQLLRKGHKAAVIAALFLFDNLLVSGAYDKEILVWNWQSSDVIQRISAHTHSLTSLVFSADFTRLYSASYDGIINVFDVRQSQGDRPEKLNLEKSFRNNCTVNAISMLADRNFFITSDTEGKVKLWNTSNGQILKTINFLEENNLGNGIDEGLVIEDEGQEGGGVKGFGFLGCAMNDEGLVFVNAGSANNNNNNAKRQVLDLKEQAKFHFGGGVSPKIQLCRDFQKNTMQIIIANQNEEERQFTIWNMKII
jgi:WD40 repeat protein